MAINWQDLDTKDRLLAAIIASFDGKINCAEVARIFGEGATYNTIENCLRKPKKLAQDMKKAATGVVTPTKGNTPKKTATPKAPRTPKGVDGVKTGRVAKTPSKKVTGSPIKRELTLDDIGENNFGSNAGSMSGGMSDGTGFAEDDQELDNDYI